jgi:hypothetical protein
MSTALGEATPAVLNETASGFVGASPPGSISTRAQAARTSWTTTAASACGRPISIKLVEVLGRGFDHDDHQFLARQDNRAFGVGSLTLDGHQSARTWTILSPSSRHSCP